MIRDLNAHSGTESLDCDVCIIGSGAAGLAIARELIPTHLRCIMLESGGAEFEQESQDLYECIISGLRFVGHMTGRFRVFGGATTRWGGQALRLTPIDFEHRDWVADSGWPIKFGELNDYYRRASEFLRIDDLDYARDLFARLSMTPPDFDPALIHYHFSKWAPQPDLRRIYRTAIQSSKNLTLLLHANLVKIQLNEQLDHVSELHVRTLSGRTGVIKARYVILCTGGIEVARLLLANNAQQKNGIGNDRDLVGRFFQDHPAAPIGVLQARRPDDVQRLFNIFYRGGLKYSVRFSASEQLQRQQRILNASGAIVFDVGETSAYVLVKHSLGMLARGQIGMELARKSVAALAGAGSLARPIYEYFIRHRGYAPDPTMRVTITSEQEPNPDSRITLSDQTDALGMPRSRIDWQLSPLTLRTVDVYARVLKEEFSRLGLGELALDPWLASDSTQQASHLNDSLHHIGTARMHDSPMHGVVDRDCRVHGIDNLFIGGSAVFPTSGHSNPTLTLIALSIRIADLLKRRIV